MKKVINVKYLAGTAMLSAVAFALMFLEFPLPMLIPGFIKFDFSDLPEVIGAFAYGPVYGVLIALIKNLLHLLTKSATGGVGELSNFLLGAVFALVAGFIYKFKHNKWGALIGGVVGAVAMGLASFVINLYLVYPIYEKLFMPREVIVSAYQAIIPAMKTLPQCLLVFNVPFTAVKGLACVLITMLIYKPLHPIIKMNWVGKKNK